MRIRLFFVAVLLLSAPQQGRLAAQDAAAPLPATSDEIVIGDALPGAFFQRPPGTDPVAAIILLGGSEGDDVTARSKAPLFLDHGFAVFGLPYYSPAYGTGSQRFANLPRAFRDIPIENLETARDWLRSRPDVRRDAIAVYGVSKGAEFALAGASRIDGFAAIVGIVPTDVIWEGWGPGTTEGQNSSFSWRGKPLPFVPYIGMNAELAKFADPAATRRIRTPHDAGRNAHPERVEPARIRVEDIRAPVLVAGGDQDTTWASGEMAQAIAERRALAGLRTVSLVFDFAGHGLSGTGEQPKGAAAPYSVADIAAQKVVWPATLRFLDENLSAPGK